MEPQTAPIDEVLTAEELADWQKVGLKFVEKNTQARRIPGQYKAGRSWRYRRADIERQILKTGKMLLDRKKV